MAERPFKRGLGAFGAGLMGSVRGQLAGLRQKRDIAEAAQIKAQQQAEALAQKQAFEREQQQRALASAEKIAGMKGAGVGRTEEQSFADWRRGVDPRGWDLDARYAYDIFQAEKNVRTAQTPEDLMIAQRNLTMLRQQNNMAISEQLRQLQNKIRENYPNMSPAQVEAEANRLRKEGY